MTMPQSWMLGGMNSAWSNCPFPGDPCQAPSVTRPWPAISAGFAKAAVGSPLAWVSESDNRQAIEIARCTPTKLIKARTKHLSFQFARPARIILWPMPLR